MKHLNSATTQWRWKHILPFMCLPVAVIVELVVGGQSDEASPRSRQREKDLRGCIFPHLMEEERLKTKDMDSHVM